MTEETLNPINTEASSASKNFLKKGWEKLSANLKENKKAIIGGILIGAGAALSASLAPGLSAIIISGRVLSGIGLGLGSYLVGGEIAKSYMSEPTTKTT